MGDKKIPRITAKEIIIIIQKFGFVFVRQKGSHAMYKNMEKNVQITIPMHTGKILHPKIVKSVIDVMDISVDDFIKLV